MSFDQCTFSQDTAADCLPTSFLDTDQLPLLSGMDMPAKCLESAPQTDGSPACECTKGMSACLIHPSTPEAWTSFMRDSLARILASLESRQAYLREPDQVFTEKSCASLAWYDQNSCSWKTYQQSFLTDSEPFSETWPRWGMTAGGSAYAHPMSERRITETGGFYWQTPLADDSVNRAKGKINTPKYWPTPTAAACNGWSPGLNRAATDDRLDYSVEREAFIIGQQTPPMRLNPNWVEWLQGFPIGFTASKDSVTPSARSKQPQPTACSEAIE